MNRAKPIIIIGARRGVEPISCVRVRHELPKVKRLRPRAFCFDINGTAFLNPESLIDVNPGGPSSSSTQENRRGRGLVHIKERASCSGGPVLFKDAGCWDVAWYQGHLPSGAPGASHWLRLWVRFKIPARNFASTVLRLSEENQCCAVKIVVKNYFYSASHFEQTTSLKDTRQDIKKILNLI